MRERTVKLCRSHDMTTLKDLQTFLKTQQTIDEEDTHSNRFSGHSHRLPRVASPAWELQGCRHNIYTLPKQSQNYRYKYTY